MGLEDSLLERGPFCTWEDSWGPAISGFKILLNTIFNYMDPFFKLVSLLDYKVPKHRNLGSLVPYCISSP